MKPDPKRIRELFVAAVGKVDPQRWEAFLEDECGGEPELLGEVRLLLDAHREAGSFLKGPAADLAALGDSRTSPAPEARSAEVTAPDCSGTVIGPYKLLQPIGEGGMGTVYMAEQTQPVRRTVALKLIKAGMDSRQVLARFEAERQALALMDHPNIAKVFDAGTTDTGRPYFVMELVKGIPITRFCDERRLTPRERLELFIPVCQAVQHAHQKGIIHRDLKPSNVLIALYDGKPVPKVIDFGVAKATGPRLTDQTLVHRVRGGRRHAGVHEPRAGGAEPARHRHPQRHLQPGRAALRAADRLDAAGSQAAEAGGDSGNAAGDPRGGVAAAEHAAVHDRGAALDRGLPQHRAAEAERAGAGRARLDRDEGAGEGPQPAVRDGQRPGGRPAAVPGRRAGAGVPAVGRLSAAKAGAATTGARCWRRRWCSWRCWPVSSARPGA